MVRQAAHHSVALAVACFVSYWMITQVLARIHSLSRPDNYLGGMWAVIATVFVYRISYEQSRSAALTRIAATLLSFALCLAYLLIFPFHPLGLAAIIGLGAFLLIVIGRPQDIVTTGITTAVVMVVAALSPQNAWEQPILRLADTTVGIAVGLAAAGIGLRTPTWALTSRSAQDRERRFGQ